MQPAQLADMEITVLTLSGGRFPLLVHPWDTINIVKEMMHDKTGIPVHQQRLGRAGALGARPVALDDFGGVLTLFACQVRPGTTLLLWRDRSAVEPTAHAGLLSLPPRPCLRRVLAARDLLYTHVPQHQFQDGRQVMEATLRLLTEPGFRLPPMKVVDFVGQMWCRSNRRLLAYRLAGEEQLVEGVHFRVYGVDRNFIAGFNYENLLLAQALIELSSLQIAPDIMWEIRRATVRERARVPVHSHS